MEHEDRTHAECSPSDASASLGRGCRLVVVGARNVRWWVAQEVGCSTCLAQARRSFTASRAHIHCARQRGMWAAQLVSTAPIGSRLGVRCRAVVYLCKARTPFAPPLHFIAPSNSGLLARARGTDEELHGACAFERVQLKLAGAAGCPHLLPPSRHPCCAGPVTQVGAFALVG